MEKFVGRRNGDSPELAHMKRNKWWGCSIVVLFTLLIAACNPQADKSTESKKVDSSIQPLQPITLTIAGPGTTWPNDEFDKYVVEPVRKKYPHITLKFINTTDKGQSVENLITSGIVPDLFAAQMGNLAFMIDLNLKYDISELIKKQKIDLNRFQPELLQALKYKYDLDMMPGLPLYQSSWVLAYNKSVFDRFGVPYPKDGMTWNEVGDLAQKLTRNDQGVQYYGLSMDRTHTDNYKQTTLPFGDFKTSKPLLQTQKWKDQFQFWLDLYRKQGSPPKDTSWSKAWDQEKRIAMRTISSATFLTFLADKDLNFDVVTFPQDAKVPGVGAEMNTHWWTVANQSKNKDAAVQVLDVLLSNEVQTMMTRSLKISVLKDSSILNQTGAEIAGAQAKNVTAFIKLKNPLPIASGTLATPFASGLSAAYNSVFYEGKDINTALRELDEKMGKELQAEAERMK